MGALCGLMAVQSQMVGNLMDEYFAPMGDPPVMVMTEMARHSYPMGSQFQLAGSGMERYFFLMENQDPMATSSID